MQVIIKKDVTLYWSIMVIKDAIMNFKARTQTEADEKEWLRLIAERGEGWQPAFRMLYDLYEKQLSLYVSSRVNNNEDGEDILQEVWKAVYEHADDFRKGLGFMSLGTLLRRIARNKITDYFRNKAIRKHTLAYEDAFARENDIGDTTPPPAAEQLTLGDLDSLSTGNMVSERELKNGIAQAVEKLDATDRLIYRMRESGHSLQEIARALGFALSTIKARSAHITFLIQKAIRNRGLV